jgi:hypothetical protein
MANGERAAQNGHHYELWAARPFAGWPKRAWVKRMCRRVERRLERARLKRESRNG